MRESVASEKVAGSLEVPFVSLSGTGAGHAVVAVLLAVQRDRQGPGGRESDGAGGVQICRSSSAGDTDSHLEAGGPVPEGTQDNADTAELRRHDRSDAEFLRVQAHAARRRVGRRFFRASVRRHIRENIPEGALRSVQRHHRVSDARRGRPDNEAAADLRPRGRVAGGQPRGDRAGRPLGRRRCLLCDALRRQRLRPPAGPEGSSFFRHNDEFRIIRPDPDYNGHVGNRRALSAALRHRQAPRRRPRALQLRRSDTADSRPPDGTGRTCRHREIVRHRFCFLLAGAILQRDTEQVLGGRCDSGYELGPPHRAQKVGRLASGNIEYQEIAWDPGDVDIPSRFARGLCRINETPRELSQNSGITGYGNLRRCGREASRLSRMQIYLAVCVLFYLGWPACCSVFSLALRVHSFEHLGNFGKEGPYIFAVNC